MLCTSPIILGALAAACFPVLRHNHLRLFPEQLLAAFILQLNILHVVMYSIGSHFYVMLHPVASDGSLFFLDPNLPLAHSQVARCTGNETAIGRKQPQSPEHA